MLAHQGIYGFFSQLSREHEISRQWLYKLRDKEREGMEIVFCAEEQRTEKKAQIERAVLTLFTEDHASRKGIQQCIKEMLGEHVSLGAISAIIHQAGQRAQEWLDQHIPKGMRVLALDEQYASKRGEAYRSARGCAQRLRAGQCATSSSGWGELVYPFVAHARSRAKVEHSRL